MTLDASKFGVAAALTAAIIWTIDTLLFSIMPFAFATLHGIMMHSRYIEAGWHLSFSGYIVGLVGWSVSVGLGGWLFAKIHNRLLNR